MFENSETHTLHMKYQVNDIKTCVPEFYKVNTREER